ncbi:hypothetical protein [Kitasatospora purpeofusca]|uniref:Uncharacterized protein n=1 Tax=Kitasatospora purpeofusca TaxID=67352 RepID=A0ABZ1UBQ6_9ACTN|nr:hypothetical protein [Kitasatospora purpeofusca]
MRRALHAATSWRADLGPATGWHRTPGAPGTADRLLLLPHRMAAPAPPAN